MNGIILALTASLTMGAPLPSWRGDALNAWAKNSHQITSVRLRDGVLTGEANGRDPFWTTGVKPFTPKATHEVVFRAKSPIGGTGEFFWAPVGAKQPTQATGASFTWIGDGQWHEYRVRPFWQGGGDIRVVRIDYPNNAMGKGEIGLADVRIIESPSPVLKDFGKAAGVSFSYTATRRGKGVFEWAASETPGKRSVTFPLAADGRSHRYYLPLEGAKGKLVWYRLGRSKEDAALDVRDFQPCADEPELPSDLLLIGANFATSACRVGTEGLIEVVLRNIGTAEARNVMVKAVSAPQGLSVTHADGKTILGGENTLLALKVKGERPLSGIVKVLVSWTDEHGGEQSLSQDVAVKILPSLGLAKAAYVPEPKPPKCAYEIGALYYPGWSRSEAWKRVWKTCPERRPYLGWYDEASPEVVDWQIKWLSESGIGAIYVDWYWHKGGIHHEHWIKAFQKAKWRNYMKWAMMWANHNPAGSHSEADQRAATQYWLDHYFNTPEYLTHDGKPVVWIWAASNMNRDLGAGGCRKLLEISRQMAVAAGYRGIHFIAMKWPEASCEPAVMRQYKEMGFDEVGIYHFMGHGGKAESPNRYSFKVVADANEANWRGQQEANVMPFLPNISTGWDDRPWNDHCEIYGKNADDFRRICRNAKRFVDETGLKRLCLSPLNEWGEGSYAEPNAEHGFGFYEAVRDTFCERPKEGWQPNVVPADVGLGPYDLPLPEGQERVTAWDFTDGLPHGWRAFMGYAKAGPSKEGFTLETNSYDPAMHVPFVPVSTRAYKTVTVRMRLEGAKGCAVVFWARDLGGMRGDANVGLPVISDGKFHDYVFRVGNHPRWKGRIGGLRLDPCENAGAKVTVESIRLGE